MSLAAEDIRFIKEHLGEWLAEQSLGKPPAVYEIELRERILRVEEELKHQRELLKTILEQMDKRFGAVDKRFDLMQEEMDRRFEAIDKHLDVLHREMDKRFDLMQEEMNRRFEAVDKRFETLQNEMNRHFEAVDKRFETLQNEMNRRFEGLTKRIDRFMMWSYATTLTVGGLVVTILKLWP